MSLFSELFGVGGGIKSIQRGVISFATGETSKTATITSVNTLKTELRKLGSSSNSAADVGAAFIRIVLTDATTITATRERSGASTASVSWELTESN